MCLVWNVIDDVEIERFTYIEFKTRIENVLSDSVEDSAFTKVIAGEDTLYEGSSPPAVISANSGCGVLTNDYTDVGDSTMGRYSTQFCWPNCPEACHYWGEYYGMDLNCSDDPDTAKDIVYTESYAYGNMPAFVLPNVMKSYNLTLQEGDVPFLDAEETTCVRNSLFWEGGGFNPQYTAFAAECFASLHPPGTVIYPAMLVHTYDFILEGEDYYNTWMTPLGNFETLNLYSRDRQWDTTCNSGGAESEYEEKSLSNGTDFIVGAYDELVFVQIYGYLATLKTISVGGDPNYSLLSSIKGAVNYYIGKTLTESFLSQDENIGFSNSLRNLISEYANTISNVTDTDGIYFKVEIRKPKVSLSVII